MKAMAYTSIARTSVDVFTAESPDDGEWEAYLRYRLEHIHDIDSVLVYSHGGTPTIQQRARMHRLPPRIIDVRGAVITSSAYVRAVYRVRPNAHWYAFSEKEWGAAFRHLNVRDDDDRLALFATVVNLAEALGLPSPNGLE